MGPWLPFGCGRLFFIFRFRFFTYMRVGLVGNRSENVQRYGGSLGRSIRTMQPPDMIGNKCLSLDQFERNTFSAVVALRNVLFGTVRRLQNMISCGPYGSLRSTHHTQDRPLLSRMQRPVRSFLPFSLSSYIFVQAQDVKLCVFDISRLGFPV